MGRWQCQDVGRFGRAGADCVYIPAPASMIDLARICAATTLPVNALAAGKFAKVSRAQFAAIGVARISLGAALARATHRVIHDVAHAMFQDRDFNGLTNILPTEQLEKLLG
ncbi:MAG: isocitrate lyase/phosphoenolpyruvate mutase family protein [Marinosulfonomonas sp.]|nr:isocitrate lyase/phosphoenolpyruvate mutase family protein [Marinosulfonomonas sp.]